MAPQYYKVVNTHAHEISGWTILSRLLHARAPHLGVMNGDAQSGLAILAFNNLEKLGYFHSRIFWKIDTIKYIPSGTGGPLKETKNEKQVRTSDGTLQFQLLQRC